MRMRQSGRGRWMTAAVLVVSLAGCSHTARHWPWHHAPPPAPTPTHELDITQNGAAAPFHQYWKRNTLLIDLSSVSGTGSLTLKPAYSNTWPARLALRVTPGAIGVLEVTAAQRVRLPITAAGTSVELELPPGAYTPATTEITVSWGPLDQPAS